MDNADTVRRARFLLAATSFAALVAAPSLAAAQIVAIPCEGDPYLCMVAPIDFSKSVDALPFTFDFDSGWIPLGSPVQVHLWGGLFAETTVKLGGFFQSAYPQALTLSAPGKIEGGELSFHYGLDVGAQGKLHLDLGFATYDWVGDLPYVPQIDFQVEGKETFDSWAFDPPAVLTSSTLPVTLAQIGISSIIGASIPGIDGGFELNVAIDLTATYNTTRIVIEQGDPMTPVDGGDLIISGGETTDAFVGPTHELFRVHPEGTLGYDGTVHLIPAFYVELLGQSWSIPIADFPIDFPIGSTDWVFDPQDVEVRFPDLRDPPEVWDLGVVPMGLVNQDEIKLFNKGEARLKVDAAMAPEDKGGVFNVMDEPLLVDAEDEGGLIVTFAPKKPGLFEATVELSTNDPDQPTVTILLKGMGTTDLGIFEPKEGSGIQQPGGCGCSVADSTSGAWLLLGGPLAALLRASTRRRRRSKPAAGPALSRGAT